MKKIFNILLLSIVLLTSCNNETIVSTDNSATNRVDAIVKGYIEELATAPHGWIAEIQTSKGYYQFYMTFTNTNMVTMYTDNLMYQDQYFAKAQTSTYNFRSLQRPTLSFDTYSYIHILNDPNDAISGGTGNMGLETDFEFEVNSYADDVFNLVGRINRVDARLRKATEYESKQVETGAMMNVLQNTANYKKGQFCYVTDNETQISVTLGAREVEIAHVREDGSLFHKKEFTLVRMNNNIDLVNAIDIEYGLLTGFSWDGSKFKARFADKTLVVNGQATPFIPLHKMFKEDGLYKELGTISSLFPSGVTNPLFMLYNKLELAFNTDLETYFSFITGEGGVAQLNLELLMPTQGIKAVYSYYIEYNEEGDQFSVEKYTYESDPTGYAEVIDNVMTENFGASQVLMKYFVGKTFKIDWAEGDFNGAKMGRFVQVAPVDATAQLYGVLL